MGDTALETVENPFTAFRFEVVLDLVSPAAGLTSPLCNAAFAECDGLEMTMEPKTVDTGGLIAEQIHLIGPVKYSQLTLRRGMTANLQLWSWFALASQPGRDSTATGTVTLWDSDGTPAAKDGLVAIEELGLVYRKLTVSGPGGPESSLGFGVSASAGFSLGAGASASIAVSGGADLNVSASASAGFGVG